ncbi:hypothetical protein BC628DRAFT_1414176 [Trametes gibbosa]|nr:hypothetical protein BC628DRAFT_1414176 [Trametes gibbosa]
MAQLALNIGEADTLAFVGLPMELSAPVRLLGSLQLPGLRWLFAIPLSLVAIGSDPSTFPTCDSPVVVRVSRRLWSPIVPFGPSTHQLTALRRFLLAVRPYSTSTLSPPSRRSLFAAPRLRMACFPSFPVAGRYVQCPRRPSRLAISLSSLVFRNSPRRQSLISYRQWSPFVYPLVCYLFSSPFATRLLIGVCSFRVAGHFLRSSSPGVAVRNMQPPGRQSFVSYLFSSPFALCSTLFANGLLSVLSRRRSLLTIS